MKVIKFIAIAIFSTVALSSMAQKIATVNQNEVMTKLMDRDSTASKFEAYQKEVAETFQAMQAEYSNKAQDLQKKMNTVSDILLAQKQKDLNRLLESLNEFEQIATQDLQDQQQKLMAPLSTQLKDAVEKVGKQGGYALVLSSEQPLYIDPATIVDITPLVIKTLGLTI